MKKLLKFTACSIAVAVSLGLSNTAQAGLVDITNYIDGPTNDGVGGAITTDLGVVGVDVGGQVNSKGEGGVADGTLVTITTGSETIKFKVSGSDSADSAPVAYFDSYSGGKHAGIGICQAINSGNQCVDSADDNITGAAGVDEILSLDFSADYANGVDIQDLYFRDANHNEDFAVDKYVDISTDGGTTYTTYQINPDGSIPAGATGQGLLGTITSAQALLDGAVGFSELIGVQTLHIKFNNQQIYLAGFLWEESEGNVPVPLPAGLLLMLSGLFGLGFLGRYKAKYL